jgi:uncharacterized protein (DUF302 family)
MPSDGLITIESHFSVSQTIDRLAEAATAAGHHVFARIDHGKGARDVGLQLRPTELLIFGNPRGGTALMQDRQGTGIDLPIRALAWEDENGQVWLGCNDTEWLAKRHGLGAASAPALAAMRTGTAKLLSSAATA